MLKGGLVKWIIEDVLIISWLINNLVLDLLLFGGVRLSYISYFPQFVVCALFDIVILIVSWVWFKQS